jgi:hypothetical protein
MVFSGHEKAMQTLAMATRFRHAAQETSWPSYRAKLLEVARDLESEADKLEAQEGLRVFSREASRAG